MAKYPRGTGGGIALGTPQTFGPARQKWRELVSAKVDSGLTRARAVKLVNQQHPGLREKMVAEANGR